MILFIGRAFIYFVVLFWAAVAGAVLGFFGTCYLFMEFS